MKLNKILKKMKKRIIKINLTFKKRVVPILQNYAICNETYLHILVLYFRNI